ncbi:MAG TPA: DNA-formamidopyrimidine glycosylase family protein [Solirubrobacterales bacterium]|jgi:endonuclease-8|nr:DNA-formamidopyrimidine glycosylase family protein [Solirubrobacterales bacterium]
MAEGDTILRAARQIGEALVGEKVEASSLGARGKTVGLERLSGRTLESVEAWGKNLFLDFGELALHSHLGMNGSWHIYPRGARWRKAPGGAWALLRGERWEAVQFGGPTLRVLPAARLRRELTARLGPDILAPDFDLATSAASLRAAPDRELGDALLDQGLLAGIGNIFKSEACFAARLDPWRRVGDLDGIELERVVATAHELMLEAVAIGRQPGAVYHRAGRPCPVCRTPITSRGQGDANRVTYWCPRCQPPFT